MRKQMCNPQSFVCNMGLGWTSLGVESLWFPPVSPRLWGDGVGGWWGPEGARSRSLGCLYPPWSLAPGHLAHVHTTENKRLSLNHTSHAEGYNFVCKPQSFVCNMGLGWTSLGIESLWFPPVSPRLGGMGWGVGGDPRGQGPGPWVACAHMVPGPRAPGPYSHNRKQKTFAKSYVTCRIVRYTK